MNQPTPTPATSLPAESARVSETPLTDSKVLLWNLTDRGLAEAYSKQRLGHAGQDINGKLVTADFARTLETALRTAEARRVEAEQRAEKYWVLLCRTVEAMGKVSPEAAPYADQWAKQLKDERDAERERNAGLVKDSQRLQKLLDERWSLWVETEGVTNGHGFSEYVINTSRAEYRNIDGRACIDAALSAAPTRRDVGVTGSNLAQPLAQNLDALVAEFPVITEQEFSTVRDAAKEGTARDRNEQ